MIEIITTVITVIGSIATAMITNYKYEERKMAILEKLSVALRNESVLKIEITELFRLLTGLRMNYSEIKKIIEDDNCIWLIHILRTTPGYVKYKDGKLHYTEFFRSIWVRNFYNFIDKISQITSLILYFFFSLLMVFAPTLQAKAISVIFLIFSAVLFVQALRNKRYSEKIDELMVDDTKQITEKKNNP